MSEQNEQLPLTRRERRMREMGETGAMDLSEVAAASAEETPEVPASPAPAVDVEIEISPVNDDGTPRSRREMRQLREEAIAAAEAQRAEAQQADETQADTDHMDAEQDEPVQVAAETVGVDEANNDSVEITPVEIDAVETDADVVTTETVAAEIIEETPDPVSADTSAAAVPDFDTLIAPPTEPFTVEELREASRAAEQEDAETSEPADPARPGAELPEAEAPTAEDSTVEAQAPVSDPANVEPADSAAQAEPAGQSKPKRRFPWNRNKESSETAADTVDSVAPETPAVAPLDGAGAAAAALGESESQAPTEAIVIDESEAAEIATETRADDTAEADDDQVDAAVIDDLSVDAKVTDASPTDQPIIVNAPDGAEPPTPEPKSARANASAESTPAPSGYSFPDIVPPEEWRSVFDDPASRATPTAGQGAQSGGDFDDLISRAVAQEGASASSNTSALILPAMPDDTGGLSGPLGGTGELYLTGSIELPKSLGETGGHSSLHDSIEMDPIMGQAPSEAQVSADHGPAPVSARHAVSARVPSSIPVVAKPTKERSKLPLVLSLTGGGLLVAVVGLGVWGASNGMFG